MDAAATESNDREALEADLGTAVSALKKDLGKQLAGPRRALAALEALGAARALDDLAILHKHVEPLRDAELGPFGLSEAQAALAARLGAHRERLKARARSTVLAEIHRLAAAQGIDVVQVAEHPVALLLAPVVAELDFDAGTAQILYAREVVSDAELSARAVLGARDAAMERIKAGAVDSTAFFERALRAYRMVLAARGLAPGERVDLVDLLAPLGLLAQGPDAWRRDAADGYPRYLLAYQLARLRRDGVLETGGLRVELGTATGGSTRNKRDVLYVPSSPADGQYHLSIRFVARTEAP